MLISAELKGCGGVLRVYMFFGSSLGKTMLNCSLIRYLKQISVLQIVAGHRSLLIIWVSWLVKIDADFLK